MLASRNDFSTEAEWLSYLRDYFAGQALAGSIACHANPSASGFPAPEQTSIDAYKFADAMLKQRAATGGGV